MPENTNKPWPTSDVSLNVILVYGGLFFGFPWSVVGLFWVAERIGPLVAALVIAAIALVIVGLCGLYLRTHA